MDPPALPSPNPDPPLTPPASLAPPPSSRYPRKFFVFLGPLLVAPILGYLLPGEFGHFFLAGSEVAALALFCVLAYLGLDRRGPRIAAWLALVALLFGVVVINVILTDTALHGVGERDSFFPSPLPPTSVLPLALVASLSLLAALPILLSRVPAWRRYWTPVIGDGEWTSVHTLALAAVCSLTLGACVPLLVLGEPPFLLIIRHPGGLESFLDSARGAVGLHLDQLYALCWTLVAAALAVGYGVRRDWTATLARLGLQRISRPQLLFALCATAVLLVAMHGVDLGVAWLWPALGWPTTSESEFIAIMAPFLTPIGAIVIGVAAGLGEEVAVRGILQPRLGIFLSNAFFTALHALQYNWDALLSVFLVGLALGVIRKRTNTTVSALVHGSYDFVLVLIGSFSVSG